MLAECLKVLRLAKNDEVLYTRFRTLLRSSESASDEISQAPFKAPTEELSVSETSKSNRSLNLHTVESMLDSPSSSQRRGKGSIDSGLEQSHESSSLQDSRSQETHSRSKRFRSSDDAILEPNLD